MIRMFAALGARKMKSYLLVALGAAALGSAGHGAVPGSAAEDAAFRSLYKELVETNTTLSSGSCTLAADRMAARLRQAGLPDAQITRFAVPEHPKDGGLVAIYPGASAKARPILLLAHLDVVEARRADWTRDPFTLVEEDGFLYGRGTLDDKAMAAIWVDALARLARGHVRLARTVKLALTCGEETHVAFNGAQWLAQNRRDLIDAEFALNEGGGGRSDGHGRLVTQSVQVGEKAYQDFTLTVTNPGGHSSQPVRENAIYVMADALAKVRDLTFPLEFNATTRAYFAEAGRVRGDDTGRAMQALVANPADTAAEGIASRDKQLNSMLRTTCVATLVNGGHALNALPQRVTANVNCRMFPGRRTEEVQAQLVAAIGNPAIAVAPLPPVKPLAQVPPMAPAVIGPMQRLVARHFPGVPLVPTMSTGATDGVYLGAVGIPTYGVPGLWSEPDGNGTHGLNERISVPSLMAGRAFLFDLVQVYAGKGS